MKNIFNCILAVALGIILLYAINYHPSLVLSPAATSTPSQATSSNKFTYTSPSRDFTLTLPQGYIVDEAYLYQPDQLIKIPGTKFTIPQEVATGTNLSNDTYLSVETFSTSTKCTGNIFIGAGKSSTNGEYAGRTYSVASTVEAAAGNRYEQMVYAFPSNGKCMAVRYFIHYGVYENYPVESIKQFDKPKLLKQFDTIRDSLVVSPQLI